MESVRARVILLTRANLVAVGMLPMNLTLWTYVSNRDLHVLYIDGASAALTVTGVLDSQEVLLARRGGVYSGRGWMDDPARLHALCAWGKDKGVEGFIRMNSGFELMWCDFTLGLDHVSTLNITTPGTTKQELGWLPIDPHCRGTPDRLLAEHENPSFYQDIRSSLADIRPFNVSPLALAGRFEWLRAAVRRHFVPQPNVRLISSGMVTFYDPALSSLGPAREEVPMYSHRVWNNISEADAGAVVDQVEEVLRRPDLWAQDDISWSSIADQVVENWGDRIVQINYTLHNPMLNASTTVRHVQLLAYTLLNPYLDTTALPHTNTSNPALWLPQAISRCVGSQTLFVKDDQLTSTERLLKSSIETVLGRLCHYAGDVLAASFETKPEDQLVATWTEATMGLMDWLDWPTWVRCQPECDLDVSVHNSASGYSLTSVQAVCAVAAWPILRPVISDRGPLPRCVSFEELTHF
jgi:hypothetical protein